MINLSVIRCRICQSNTLKGNQKLLMRINEEEVPILLAKTQSLIKSLC